MVSVNYYSLVGSFIVLGIINIGIIVMFLLELRDLRMENAELQYELDKYESYDDEEKRTEEFEEHSLEDRSKWNIDLSKEECFKEH